MSNTIRTSEEHSFTNIRPNLIVKHNDDVLELFDVRPHREVKYQYDCFTHINQQPLVFQWQRNRSKFRIMRNQLTISFDVVMIERSMWVHYTE